jgi:hypothetical protein
MYKDDGGSILIIDDFATKLDTEIVELFTECN